MGLARRIRELRANRRWTQQKLAAKVNVSSQVVSNWEREYTVPGVHDITRLAEVFGVSIDFLTDGQRDHMDPEWDTLIEAIRALGVETEAKGVLRAAISDGQASKEILRLNRDMLLTLKAYNQMQ